MPVFGVSPCRVRCDLPVYDFLGYPLGDLQGACDGRGFRELTVEIPAYFSWLVGFGVDPNSRRKSSVIRKPVLRGSSEWFVFCS
jgi:hypothetical protein